ncbi:hypothetical protein TRVL_07209 [Trypanosoma vivax]|nr:hypothetical protein TRVL_07209 [Trypanosoma vivax]
MPVDTRKSCVDERVKTAFKRRCNPLKLGGNNSSNTIESKCLGLPKDCGVKCPPLLLAFRHLSNACSGKQSVRCEKPSQGRSKTSRKGAVILLPSRTSEGSTACFVTSETLPRLHRAPGARKVQWLVALMKNTEKTARLLSHP